MGEQGPGNVFFLGSVFGTADTTTSITRNITVPTGSRIFVPVLGVVWDNIGADPPLTVPQLYEQAAAALSIVTELHASIDGRPVQNLFSYRVRSDPFCYTVPATDNIYQFFGFPAELLAPFACPAGFCICPAVSDGYWLLLTPLSPGMHTINFGGTYGAPVNFVFDISYNITVVPRGQYQGCQ